VKRHYLLPRKEIYIYNMDLFYTLVEFLKKWAKIKNGISIRNKGLAQWNTAS